MSMCIILMRHQSRLILIYMGKLRFTLTNILFWVVLLLSCFLSENFALFNNDPLKGFSIDSAFILTISIIALLVLYYFLEHKKNKLTFDRILLPIFGISALLLIFNIFRQGTITFTYSYGFRPLVISFSIQDRIRASLQVMIWLAVIYALVFVYNRFRLNKESLRWVAKIYVFVVLGCCVIDMFVEGNSIINIFRGTYEGGGLMFLMGNENVWSLLIFSGLLSTVLLSYKKFRWQYYAIMVFLFGYNLFTTCTITTLIGLFVIVAYTIFEIFNRFKGDKKKILKASLIFLGAIVVGIALFRLLSFLRVPLISSLWSFNKNLFLYKDISSLSERVGIWQKIFFILKNNAFDMILGLGHKTGNKIFLEFTHGIRSAHNGFLEIVLRYGLLGLLVYLGVIGLTIYALVLHVRKKNYRFAFIYGLCFVSILGHSMLESTTLFTPNVGGIYFGFVFVLPILNILQEKHFNKLKEELLAVETHVEKLDKSTPTYAIIALLGEITLTIIIAKLLHLDLFSSIIILLVLIAITLVIISLLRKNKGYNPINIISNNFFSYYQSLIRKENDNE